MHGNETEESGPARSHALGFGLPVMERKARRFKTEFVAALRRQIDRDGTRNGRRRRNERSPRRLHNRAVHVSGCESDARVLGKNRQKALPVAEILIHDAHAAMERRVMREDNGGLGLRGRLVKKDFQAILYVPFKVMVTDFVLILSL